MVIADVRWLRDLSLGFTLRRELVDGAIGQTRDQLLPLRTPANTADLGFQGIAEAPLLQICHVQIPIVGDNSTQFRLFSRRIREEASKCLAIRRQLEGGLRVPLQESLHIVDSQTAAGLG